MSNRWIRYCFCMPILGSALVSCGNPGTIDTQGKSPAVAAAQIDTSGQKSAGPSRSNEQSLPIDGNYKIGDTPNDSPAKWRTANPADARFHPFLIPVSIDNVVVGFIRSDDFFKEPSAPDQHDDGIPHWKIFDQLGAVIGQFVDGKPVVGGKG